jgi:signal transduction histidine kinase/CheY-like chemotaxis protein
MPKKADSPSATQGTLMPLFNKDASGTVRVLRWLTLVAFLLPALLFAAAAWKDRSTILENAEDDGVRIAALFREQAGNLFSGHEVILDMIVDRVAGRDWETIQMPADDILRELEVMDLRLDDESAIVVVDAAGKLRATTVHVQPNEPQPTADQYCFLALRGNEVESCISQPHTDPGSGRYLFTLSRRLEKDGAFNGIAQVAISADYIVDLWASAAPNSSDIVTMFKADGTILAQSRLQSQTAPSLPDVGKTLIGKIGQHDSGIIRGPLSTGGVDWITVFTKVPKNPVYISLSLDKNAILETWHANLTVYGLVAASATAGILMALSIALRRAQRERDAVNLWRAEVHERESAQELLRQSQKMESLGNLTGGIAHDFNNLLTVIIGNISMVKSVALDGDAQRYLRNALKAGETAISLTQGLLAFARKQALQPKSVDLLGLVQGMQGSLVRTLGPDVRLAVAAEPDLWPALVDANQIELIILNLAINANDAMPKGGTLSITASNGESGPDAPHDLAPGQYVVLTVADTGTGMDETTLARATEPFFSTKQAGKGTGLGLSIMQGVVTQSGGATRLHSRLGQGTQIEVWLPRAHTPPEASERDAVHSEQRDSGAILVCDDNSAVLEFICDALQGKGYQVLPVTNGRMALSVLKANRAIRLLVVDFTMPEMSGAAVAREVRASRPRFPILLITGNADPESIQADLPDVPMLRKPFDREQLTARVADLLEIV